MVYELATITVTPDDLGLPVSSPKDFIPEISGKKWNPKDVEIKISGIKFSRKLDKKEASGKSKAAITNKGVELLSFRMSLKACTDAGAILLNRFVSTLSSRDPNLRAIKITHPWLDLYDCDAFIAEHVSGPEVDSDASQTLEVDFVEWAGTPEQVKSLPAPKSPVKDVALDAGKALAKKAALEPMSQPVKLKP